MINKEHVQFELRLPVYVPCLQCVYLHRDLGTDPGPLQSLLLCQLGRLGYLSTSRQGFDISLGLGIGLLPSHLSLLQLSR